MTTMTTIGWLAFQALLISSLISHIISLNCTFFFVNNHIILHHHHVKHLLLLLFMKMLDGGKAGLAPWIRQRLFYASDSR